MTQETAAVRKDTQRLQRAIVDGLEDVKGQDIAVFNTEHLSPLFERVIVASGTSNRQTKALAASVRDSVREAGFPKPRIEGEENGEWIIVDCGAAVAHIMQPAIRSYYHLEEIWGEKPVRLKFGAPAKAATGGNGHKAAAKKASPMKASPNKEPAARTAGKTAAKKASGKKATAAKKTVPSANKATANKATAKTATGKVATAKTAPARKTAAKKAAPKRRG
jgi:ribosome-associated protein